jgi:isocitrate lyase
VLTISPTATWSSSPTASCCNPAPASPNLYQFKEGTGEDRVVLDCITSLQNGADLLWIETEKPHVGTDRRHGQPIRESRSERQARVQQLAVLQLDPELPPAGVRCLERRGQGRLRLRSQTADECGVRRQRTGAEADARIRTFQADASREAGIFHHLITLPTYHTAALSTDNLAREYFGDAGMLGYVKNVQRQEIRQGIACVKHQNMAGSDMGDDHKEYFAGDAALKAGGRDNTMNQFG